MRHTEELVDRPAIGDPEEIAATLSPARADGEPMTNVERRDTPGGSVVVVVAGAAVVAGDDGVVVDCEPDGAAVVVARGAVVAGAAVVAGEPPEDPDDGAVVAVGDAIVVDGAGVTPGAKKVKPCDIVRFTSKSRNDTSTMPVKLTVDGTQKLSDVDVRDTADAGITASPSHTWGARGNVPEMMTRHVGATWQRFGESE